MDSFAEDDRSMKSLACSKGHMLCKGCSRSYIEFCSKNYATGNIPIKCQICKEVYEDRLICYLCDDGPPGQVHQTQHPFPLKHNADKEKDSGKKIWEMYLKASLDAGILHSTEKSLPVECKRCVSFMRPGLPYFELYQPSVQEDTKRYFQDILTMEETPLLEKYGKAGADFYPYIQRRNWSIYGQFEDDEKRKALMKGKDVESSIEKAAATVARTLAEEPIGLYMHCKRKIDEGDGKSIACGGSTCLRCFREVKRDKLFDHDCEANLNLDKMYNEIIEVLDSASFQTCPHCLTKGVKDLACTHITCNKCKKKWCYLCRSLKEDLPGKTFTNHNKWKGLDSRVKRGHCPMYLHYVYKGSAKNSLTLFHLHKQKLALEAYKEGFSEKQKMTFDMVINDRFRGQLFDKSDLQKLEVIIKRAFPTGFKGFEAAAREKKSSVR